MEVENEYLWEQRPLVTLELQAVDDESLHRLGRGAVQLTEVRRQVAASNHEDYLAHRVHRGRFRAGFEISLPQYPSNAQCCLDLNILLRVQPINKRANMLAC